MTRSIINGKHIPESEFWVWRVHLEHFNSARAGRSSEQRDHLTTHTHGDNHCGRCGQEQAELFEFKSPLSNGYHTWCHDCMMKMADFFGNRTCPVCGFGFAGSGHGKHHCIFRHEWKEEGGRKVILTPLDRPPERKEVLICAQCGEWNEVDAKTCRHCGAEFEDANPKEEVA